MAGRVETTRLQFQISINGERKILKSLKEVRQIRRQLNKEIETGKLTQEEYNQKVQELRKLDSILNDHKKNIRGTSKAYGAAGKSATGFSGIIQKLGGVMKTALGPIGLLVAAGTYLVNMGIAAFRVSQEMQKLRERINQVTGLVGTELNEAAATVQALGNAFEVDVTKGIDAANAAANVYQKQGETLGETYQRTLDGIGARLAGLDGKGDEFLEQVTEYSVQAKKAGIEMDEFFNIVTASINRGVPTDKLIDSIKEFDIRIKTITKGQKETLEKTFGKQFTDQLLKDIESGEVKSIDALKNIGSQIEILGDDSAAAQRVMSDLFGGPGEDATASYLSLLQSVDGNLNSVIDTTNKYYRDRQELFELEKEANLAVADLSAQLDGTGTIFKKVGLIIKTGFVNFLAETIEFIRYFPEYFAAATSSAKAWANGFISVLEKVFINLNPVTGLLEKLLGVEIKLPRFDIEDDPYGKVQEKIEADRKLFEESQRQKALEEQQKTEAARRLQALQAEKRKQELLGNMKQKERKALAKAEEEAQRRIEDLRIAVMEEGAEKQIALLRLKAEREISALKGTAAQKAEAEKLIRANLATQIAKIEEKAGKAASTKITKAKQEEFKKRKAALEKLQAEKTLLITQDVIHEIEAGADIEDADAEVKARLLAEQKNFLLEKKKLLEEFGEDTTEIELKIAQLDLSNFAPDPEKEDPWPAIIEKAEQAAQAINVVSDLISANNQKNYQEDLKALEDAKAKELKLAGDNEKRKTAIEKKYQTQIDALNEEQAKKEKQISITIAIINTALSVTKALASAPPPANFIAAAINAAAGAAEIATIKAQTFKFGGLLPGKGGLPQGPSHQEGHILLIDGKTGEAKGAIEGGEPILSKETYKNNKEVINQLLDTSLNRGGKRIYRDGGLEGSFFQAPSTIVTNEVVENTRTSSDVNELSGRLDQLIVAYKEGKIIMMGEREAELIGDTQSDLEGNKIRRAL